MSKSKHLVHAALDLRQGDEFQQAASLLEQAIELDPMYIPSYILLGLVYQDQAKFSDAETIFREALAREPENPEALQCLGMLYLQQQRFPEAIANFEKHLELEPENETSLDVLIPVLSQLERIQDAEAFLQAAWLKSKNSKIAVRLARFLISNEKIDQAHQFLHNALSVKKNANLLVEMALVLVIKDKYLEAVDALQEALSLRPDYDRAYRGLAQCYTHLNQPAKALESAERAISLDPKHYRNWQAKADAFLRMGNFELALEASKMGESFIQPNDQEALPVLEVLFLQQLSALSQLDKIDQALDVSQRAREKFPDREDFYVLEVQNLLWQNRLKDALELLERAKDAGVSLAHDLAPFYYGVLHQAGQPKQALDFIVPISSERSKQYLDILANQGIRLYQQGYISATQSLFNQLIEMNPDEPRFAMNLGFILVGENDLPQAEALFKKALLKEDQDCAAILKCNLGYLYLLQNRLDEAYAELVNALELAEPGEGAILRVAFWGNGQIIPDFAPHSIRFATISAIARANLTTWALSQENYEKANKWAQEIISEESENPLGHEMLGCSLCAQGDLDGCKSSWKKALELVENPNEKAMLDAWLAKV